MLVLNGYVVEIPFDDKPFKISIFRVDNDKPGGRGDLMVQNLHHPNDINSSMFFDLPFIGGEYGFEVSGPCTIVPKYACIQPEQESE